MIPGFGNTEHDDAKNKHLANACLLRMKVESVRAPTAHEERWWKYANKLIENFGLGMKTTCGYYLDITDDNLSENDNIFAYFIMSGLGCVVRLRSHYNKSNMILTIFVFTYSRLSLFFILVTSMVILLF